MGKITHRNVWVTYDNEKRKIVDKYDREGQVLTPDQYDAEIRALCERLKL